MKQETKKLIEELKDWYDTYRSQALTPDWLTSTVDDEDYLSWADEGASRMDKIISVLDRLEETESILAKGGLVKDSAGNWLKEGDVVYFRRDVKGETYHGSLEFDSSLLCWFILRDDGEYFRFGVSSDITWFVSSFDELKYNLPDLKIKIDDKVKIKLPNGKYCDCSYTELNDFWYGFVYKDKMYDLNVWKNGDTGELSAAIYPVIDGETRTQELIPVEIVKE